MKNALKSNSCAVWESCSGGPVGEARNMAVVPDRHSGAWGGFGADRRACSSLPRPPGEADWINSSLRTSCSLRGHQGKVGWKEKMERLYLALIGLLPVCTLDCSINTALSAARLKWYSHSCLLLFFQSKNKVCHCLCSLITYQHVAIIIFGKPQQHGLWS